MTEGSVRRDDRRPLGIEALLSWAYRDELPKAGGRGVLLPPGHGRAWGGIERYGELLTEIDEGENRWGLAPDLTATASPHPDAERVGAAVEALDERCLGLPDGWNPLDDIVTPENAELVQDSVLRAVRRATRPGAAGELALVATPRFLVVRHALGRSAPDWSAEPPVVQVESANGKARWFRRITMSTADGESYEQEVDGYDRGRKRPMPGAYRKSYLDPDPTDAAVSRAEWEVWRAALDVLARDLADLESVQVLPCARPWRPWMAPAGAARRVIPSLAPVHKIDYGDVSLREFYRRRVPRPLTRGSRLP